LGRRNAERRLSDAVNGKSEGVLVGDDLTSDNRFTDAD
jgi:hypothetical protein